MKLCFYKSFTTLEENLKMSDLLDMSDFAYKTHFWNKTIFGGNHVSGIIDYPKCPKSGNGTL